MATEARSPGPRHRRTAADEAGRYRVHQIARSVKRKKSKLGALSDQVLSSLSNMVPTVVIAHNLSPADLGRFAVIFAGYLLVLGFSRAYVQEPLLITLPVQAADGRGRYRLRCYGAGLTVGVVAAGLGLLLAIPVQSLRGALIPVSLLMPLLILQDVIRYDDFARGLYKRAIATDGLWLVGVLATEFWCHSLFSASLAWAATGAVTCLIVAPVQVVRSIPHLLRIAWFRDNRSSGGFFAVEFLLFQVVQQASIWLVAGLSSLANAGAYRAAQVTVAPLKTITGGLTVALLPGLVTASPTAIARTTRTYAVVNGAIGALWALAIVLVPNSLGKAVLGDVWPHARWVGLALCLAATFSAFSQSQILIIKACQQFRRSLMVRLVTAPVTLVAVVVGVLIDGALGAAVGLACASGAMMVLWRRAGQGVLADAVAELTRAATTQDVDQSHA